MATLKGTLMGWVSLREVDFLVTATALAAAVLLYGGGARPFGLFAGWYGNAPIGTILVVLLLVTFFGALALAAAYAFRAGDPPRLVLSLATAATLVLQVFGGYVAAVAVFVSGDRVGWAFPAEGGPAWIDPVQRVLTIALLLRALAILVAASFARGGRYIPGDTGRTAALVCGGLAVVIVVAGRIAGAPALYALVDAWMIAGVAGAAFAAAREAKTAS